MVVVSPKDYRFVWGILARLRKKGVEITSENVIELIKKAGFKKNNSTIRRLIYDGISIGLIKNEFIYTGSMTLNRHYIPEKYDIDVEGYRKKLLKKIDSYLNISYEKLTDGFGFAFKCDNCGNPLISPTETKCPVCGSQNLSPTSLDEVKKKYFELIKSLPDSKLLELASVEVEGGIPAVAKRLKKMLINKAN